MLCISQREGKGFVMKKICTLAVLVMLSVSSLIGCGASAVQPAPINPASQQKGEQLAREEMERSEQERRAREAGASETVSTETSTSVSQEGVNGAVASAPPPPTATVSTPPPPAPSVPVSQPVIIAQQSTAVMMPSPMMGLSSPYPSMAPMAAMFRRPVDPRCRVYMPGFAYVGSAASRVCGSGGSHCTRLKISRTNLKVKGSQFVGFSYQGREVAICLPDGSVAGGIVKRPGPLGKEVMLPRVVLKDGESVIEGPIPSIVPISTIHSEGVWIATPIEEGEGALTTTYYVDGLGSQYAVAAWIGESRIGFRYTTDLLPKLAMRYVGR